MPKGPGHPIIITMGEEQETVSICLAMQELGFHLTHIVGAELQTD